MANQWKGDKTVREREKEGIIRGGCVSEGAVSLREQRKKRQNEAEIGKGKEDVDPAQML